MDDSALFDDNLIRIEDIENIIHQPISDQNIPKVLTINGKFLDEDIGLELAELFPPDVLGAKNQMNSRYWTCKHCLKIENNISAYAKHLREHYKCRQLPKDSVQDSEEVIECDICNKKFSQQFFLYRHMQIHTGEFTCSMCLTIYSRKKDLMNHQQNCKDGDEIVLQCLICKLILQTRAELKDHLILNHSSKKHRNNNEEIFSTRTIDDTLRCTFCGKSYRKRYLLNNHIKNKHNMYGMNADKECFICDAKFNSETSARRHKKLHTHGKIYKCQSCDMSFVTEYLLKQHNLKHDTATYSCSHCDTVVRYRHSLTRHVKKYHFDKISDRNTIEMIKGNKPLKKTQKNRMKQMFDRRHLQKPLLPMLQSEIISETQHNLDDVLISDNFDIFNENNNVNEDKIVNLSMFDFSLMDGLSLQQLNTTMNDGNNFDVVNLVDEDQRQIYVDTDTGELVFL